MTAIDKKNWESELKSCVKNIDKIEGLAPLADVSQIAAEHDLDMYAAALLYHSKKDSQDT